MSQLKSKHVPIFRGMIYVDLPTVIRTAGVPYESTPVSHISAAWAKPYEYICRTLCRHSPCLRTSRIHSFRNELYTIKGTGPG